MWTAWRSHFETNATRPLPAMPTVADIPASWRGALGDSLARFQLGEAGEGRVAKEIDRAVMAGVDDDYRASLKLFVREEGRHARILAGMVRALGGELLRQSWSERLFVHGRRMLGLRVKLLVLLVAEVVGLGFYTILERRLGEAEVGRQLREIAGDEEAHLEFHAAFFRLHARGAVGRGIFKLGWWTIGALACATVLFDHRRTLRVMGVPRIEAVRRFAALLRRVDTAVLRSSPRVARGAAAWARVSW
ncbi:MAG: hypothetical protein JNL82_16540 [Myxococcales bacterium]|nr:hypothetical protein [Myxococcales bacterium]